MSKKNRHPTVPESPSWAYDNLDIDFNPESQSTRICQDTTLIEEGREVPTATAADLLSVLPPELISDIFCLACKPIHGNNQWKRDCHPFQLGQLSRQYRHNAWATSELWTTVIIRLVPSKVATQTELLEEWLARAMGRPIDIYFEIQETYLSNFVRRGKLLLLAEPSRNAQSTIFPMIDLLARHSLQWQCVEFHIPNAWYPFFTPLKNSDITAVADDGGVTEPASPKRRLDLPLLISASLRHDRQDNQVYHWYPPVGLDLTLAPSLRVLSLSLFRMSPAIFERADFKQITSLTFHSVDDINPHVLLPQLPNLEEAAFHHTKFLPTPLDQTIRHQKLRKLEVETDTANQLECFLPVLNLPRLESLSVCVPTTMHYSNVFTQAVPYREVNLTSLSVACNIDVEFDLIGILFSLSSLRELHIRDRREHHDWDRQGRYNWENSPEGGLTRQFFDILHPDKDLSYLPFLEVLSYEGTLVVQAIDFLEPLVIRSRMGGGSSEAYAPDLQGIAVLRKVKIQADQMSQSEEFSIAGYPDAQYVWEILRMMEEGILELITMNGEVWQ